jgi:hypothetical protein
MGYPTRPSNVRVCQFRQPPGCSRLILRDQRIGTRGKSRTRNLLIRSQALYPLSYWGVRWIIPFHYESVKASILLQRGMRIYFGIGL